MIGSIIVKLDPDGLTGGNLRAEIMRDLGSKIEFRNIGEGLLGDGEPDAEIAKYRPDITVVICTHERPDGLRKCIESLLAQTYGKFRVLVIDNAPESELSKSVVDGFASSLISYAVEPIKGLSRARNRALKMIRSEIVAWIDDDEIADPDWLLEIARGFQSNPEACAVAGVMVPGELETWPQVWYEQYGGHNKLRGYTPAVYSPETLKIQSPYYPLPPFGTGGNMSFKVNVLREFGGFDTALGAGSRTMGAEDTLIFSELLGAGRTVVYQPTAVTRHFHRRSIGELQKQMFGYGIGLTAFYTSLLMRSPRRAIDIARLVPLGYRDLFSKNSLQSSDLPPSFPQEMLRIKRKGMLMGPYMYVRARRDAARVKEDD